MPTRTLTWLALSPLVSLFGGCFNPVFTPHPPDSDGGTMMTGFRCFISDTEPCPSGQVCCADVIPSGAAAPIRLCGDQLKPYPKNEGWCMIPTNVVQDLSFSPIDYWDMGVKTSFYPGPMGDPMLTGNDDGGNPRCHYKDINQLEPNDTADKAISTGAYLTLDAIPGTYSNYEICHLDDTPDIDVIRFRLQTAATVVVEAKYLISTGDLDMGLFKATDAANLEKPALIQADLSAKDNACIVARNLPATTDKNLPYYVAVRGAPSATDTHVFNRNRYQFKVYAVSPGNPSTCAGAGTPDMKM